MNQQFNSFLGTGWAFPPAFDRDAATVALVSDEEDIKQSLNILLSTSHYLFEPLSSSMIGFIKDRVESSILIYESRIVVDKIEVTPDDSFDLMEGRFIINVEYTIPGTNSRFNYVYDYYKNEALKPV